MNREQTIATAFERFAKVRRQKPDEQVIEVVGIALDAAGMQALNPIERVGAGANPGLRQRQPARMMDAMTQDQTTPTPTYCRKCGYELQGLSENRCPECGRAFDPADSRTYSRHPHAGPIRRLLIQTIKVLAMLSAMAVVALGTTAAILYRQWHEEQLAIRAIHLWGGEAWICAPDAAWQEYVFGERDRVDASGLAQYEGGLLGGRLAWLTERIGSVDVQNGTVGDDSFGALAHLRSLDELSLRNTRVDHQAWQALARLRNLKSLIIHDLAMPDDALASIEQLPLLSDLHLRNLPLSDAALTHLTQLPNLTILEIECDRISDAGLATIGQIRALRQLKISGKGITDEGLQALTGLTDLISLSVSSPHVTGSGLKYLKKLPDLWDLNLSSCPIMDANLVYMRDLHEVVDIDLSVTPVTDAGIKHLLALPALHRLVLSQTKVTPQAALLLREHFDGIDIIGR